MSCPPIWFFYLVLAQVLSECSANKNLSNIVDINVGLIVGSRRLRDDAYYLRPGKHFYNVFSRTLANVNLREAEAANQNITSIRLRPIVAETYGKESESIKQTVKLITEQKVHFILGPQESCKFEAQLASIYNVPLLSHFCPQTSLAQPGSSTTLIQTKPPSAKIVSRVQALVNRLLTANNRQSYPQQLVLLYFKESPDDELKSCAGLRDCRRKGGQRGDVDRDSSQYSLIGELLEIKLRQLLTSSNETMDQGADTGGVASLSVLNWHSTFHYGFTKNPFRQLVRQNLFKSYGRTSAAANLNRLTGQCTGREEEEHRRSTLVEAREHSAIYIIVGHYYEHLGLMLALNELDLLADDGRPSGYTTAANKEAADGSRQGQRRKRQRKSLVIGVDIEQYDERDDSVRFLRGLLMDDEDKIDLKQDQSRQAHGQLFQQFPHSAPNLESIASMYRRYLGVVPSRPTFTTAELLNHLRSFDANQGALADSTPVGESGVGATSSPSNQTLDSAQLGARLLQFARLPVESYYLYDSIQLLHAYLADCLRVQGLSLALCSQGDRAAGWFANRTYQSIINQNLSASFDERAQADGFYTLIGRRSPLSPDDHPDSSADDELSLVPVGQFVGNEGLEFLVQARALNHVWLALWCEVERSNDSICITLGEDGRNLEFDVISYQLFGSVGLIVQLCLISLLVSLAVTFAALISRSGWRGQVNRQQTNQGWFVERDERNFVAIVKNFLITAERQLELSNGELIDYVDLHCYMFQFPSCKFVHWISTLFQLKELMFQYQSQYQSSQVKENKARDKPHSSCRWLAHATSGDGAGQRSSQSSVDFFRSRHKSTGTLRLLLNKYRTINESFIELSALRHHNVASIKGLLLNYSAKEGKIARLALEGAERANLRQALQHLDVNVDLIGDEGQKFRFLLTKSCIKDILNGLEYLHSSKIQSHGQLMATTCLVSLNWRLKLSGFHANHMRRSLGDYEQKFPSSSLQGADCHLDKLVYQPPEILGNLSRSCALKDEGLRLADFYSFAFVLYELLAFKEPWSCLTQVTSSRLLIERVKVDSSFRPPLSLSNRRPATTTTTATTSTQAQASSSAAASSASSVSYATNPILSCESLGKVIRSCWSHSPDRRPQSVHILRSCIESSIGDRLRDKEIDSCADVAIAAKSDLDSEEESDIMAFYTRFLEKLSAVWRESLRSEQLSCVHLRNVFLPESILSGYSSDGSALDGEIEPRLFNTTSLCLVKLTPLTDLIHQNPIGQLEEILAQLDNLVASYRGHIHAFESQADSLMRWLVVAGGPLNANNKKRKTSSPKAPQSIYNPSQLLASFALQLIDLINRLPSDKSWQVKCALHYGPVTGSITRRPRLRDNLARYVLVGNSLKTLETIELSCPNQRIQISSSFRSQLLMKDESKLCLGSQTSDQAATSKQGYVLVKREGKIASRGQAEIETYWLLNGPKLTLSQSLMLSS